MAYSFNQALSVYPLDAASGRAMVLCEVPMQGGSNLRYAIPTELLGLLKMFDGRRQISEVFKAYGKLYPGKYSEEKIANLVEKFLLPKNLLVDLDSSSYLPERSLRRPYLYAKVRLIPPQIISPVAKMFGWAFNRLFLVSWLALFIIAHLAFYLWLLPAHPVRLSDLTGSTFSIVMLLSLLAAFIHEAGHASALISSGCKQTEIGVGLYIYMPVFYTDVSEAWKLSRHQRAIIDIAGVYFQSVFQLLLLALFWIGGSTSLLYAFLFIDLIMFRTMNPFLRMDGYWLVADLFGIFNLREQSMKLIKHYVLKLFRPSRTGNALPRNLNRRAGIALTVYSVLCTAFFFYLCAIMIRFSIMYLIPTYPTRLLAVWQVAQEHPLNLIKIFGLIFEVLWRTAVLCGLALFAYRLVQGLGSFLNRLLKNSAQTKVYATSPPQVVEK